MKKILGTSDVWSTSRLSHQPSEPAYKIADCRIFSDYPGFQPKTTHLSKAMQHTLYIVRVICNDLITHYHSIQVLDLKDLIHIQVVILDGVYYLLCTYITYCTTLNRFDLGLHKYSKHVSIVEILIGLTDLLNIGRRGGGEFPPPLGFRHHCTVVSYNFEFIPVCVQKYFRIYCAFMIILVRLV